MNKVKDYYLTAIDWIAAHPHAVFWLSLAAVAGALAV